MYKLIIPVTPRTKKNHGQLVTLKNGRKMMLPSKAYAEFEKAIIKWYKQFLTEYGEVEIFPINQAINFKAVFYKDRNYKSDLTGYLQGIQDALVKAGFLEDDNTNIIASVDGSRVELDRENPRIELEITLKGINDEKSEK